MSNYGPEPAVNYATGGDDYADAWYAWASKHTTDELEQLADQLGAWCPADDPDLDDDAQMVKWEMACTLLAQRKALQQ